MTSCATCQTPLPPGPPAICWYCLQPLCGACWDAAGHCGHPEAEALTARVRAGYRPTAAELMAGHPLALAAVGDREKGSEVGCSTSK